jgi:hypothetical protein
MAEGNGGLLGRVYEIEATAAGAVRLLLAEVALPDLEIVDGELTGADVSVECRCVLVERVAGGELFGRPMEPIAVRDAGLCFHPEAGGVRTRENRLAAGAFNRQIAEAARFGMINAFFHVERAARYVNGLLRELGAPELPPLHVVVSAHSGSRLPGYGQADGTYRRGRLRPFQGGHYRLSSLTTHAPEPIPVRPTGEVHLGPGRYRQPFAGHPSYLRSAAHNPATIYHEFGHHLCRHTADFRLNGERVPEAQRNGKTGPEEGVCDYLAASLLGTGRPYGWYRPKRGERRDPETSRPPITGDQEDAHAVGARWAGALWRARQTLLRQGLIDSPRDHDRAVVQTLLDIGGVAARPGDRRPRRDRAAERSAPETIVSRYLAALAAADGRRAAVVAAGLLEAGGLFGGSDPAREISAC